MFWLLLISASIGAAVYHGLYRKPLSTGDKEKGATLGRAIHNSVSVQFGESLAGQRSWEFGPPPPLATYEPEGHTVSVLSEDPVPPDDPPVPADGTPPTV
ncbi:MAG: hypothetical protein V4850_26340 [Myxococcota bacterium]